MCTLAPLVDGTPGSPLVRRLQDVGGEPAPMTSGQFRGFIQSESSRFAKLVTDAKITPDN